MDKWREFHKREDAREELIQELNRGTREINKGLNEISGWADRIMKSIRRPLGESLDTEILPAKKGAAHYKAEK